MLGPEALVPARRPLQRERSRHREAKTSYAVVSWEVRTGDPIRAARITQAAEAALGGFSPAHLLVNCFLVDSESQNVEDIRAALDGIVASYPQEFFFTTSDQVEADIQGSYPPFAKIEAARVITGSERNPRRRPLSTVVVADTRGPRARGLPPPAAPPAERKPARARKKGARQKHGARRPGRPR